MRTVKELKDAGLVFVSADILNYAALGVTSSLVLNESGLFDDKIFEGEFAWRTNMSEASKFDGDAEVELKEGQILTFMSCMVEGMSNPKFPNPAIKWRPVISKEDKMSGLSNMKVFNCQDEINAEVEKNLAAANESKRAKPLYYTKEMHKAECQSILGMRYIDGGGEECELIGENNQCGVFVGKPILEHDAKYLSVWPKEDCKPIDSRTDEEKLIDEACDIVAEFDNDPLQPYEETVERMIKAGYRKS